MPAFDAYEGIFTALEVDVRAALPETGKVHRGWPRLVQKSWPYAVIWLNPEAPISQEPESAQGTYQRPDIRITYVAPLPADKSLSVLDQQIEDANALCARLERNNYYQSVAATNLAVWPWARIGELPVPGDDESTYEVNVIVDMTMRVLHTSKQ